MIEVRYYGLDGELAWTSLFATAELAFEDLVATRRIALAKPMGTTSGCYNWDPSKEGHTLENFKAILECCCNNPKDYHDAMNAIRHMLGY